MDLIQMLTSQLGVDEKQAKGGAGLLFGLAKDKLSGGDFDKVKASVPGVDALLKGAPSTGIAGALGGLAASFTGRSELAGLGALAGGFKELGLDSGMISKFVPILLGFVQSQGGDQIRGLLEKALR